MVAGLDLGGLFQPQRFHDLTLNPHLHVQHVAGPVENPRSQQMPFPRRRAAGALESAPLPALNGAGSPALPTLPTQPPRRPAAVAWVYAAG